MSIAIDNLIGKKVTIINPVGWQKGIFVVEDRIERGFVFLIPIINQLCMIVEDCNQCNSFCGHWVAEKWVEEYEYSE